MRSANDLFHDRRADKDAREEFAILKEGKVKARLEALNLTTKVVAMDAHSETTDEFLATLFGGVGFIREEDETSASSPNRPFLNSVSVSTEISTLRRVFSLDKVSQGLKETRLSGDKRDCGAFAAWDDEAIALGELFLSADLDAVELCL